MPRSSKFVILSEASRPVVILSEAERSRRIPRRFLKAFAPGFRDSARNDKLIYEPITPSTSLERPTWCPSCPLCEELFAPSGPHPEALRVSFPSFLCTFLQ